MDINKSYDKQEIVDEMNINIFNADNTKEQNSKNNDNEKRVTIKDDIEEYEIESKVDNEEDSNSDKSASINENTEEN